MIAIWKESSEFVMSHDLLEQYDSIDGILIFGIVIKFTSMLVGDDVVVVEIIVV